jgi:hypothetical protein
MIFRNLIADLQHVIVGGGKKFFSKTRPFFVYDSKLFVVGRDKPEIPACPASLQHTEGSFASIQHFKFSANRKKFLFELSDHHIFIVQHLNGRKPEGNASFYGDELLSRWCFNIDFKRGEPFVICKP